MREVLLGLTGAPETMPLFGVSVPRAYGGLRGEWEALSSGAAVVPAPWERIVLFRGSERREFLQSMLTQDVGALAPGRCVAAAQADRKGHLVADLWVGEASAGGLVRVRMDVAGRFLELLDRHRISEDVSWNDPIPDDPFAVLLAGPAAAALGVSAGIPWAEGSLECGVLPDEGCSEVLWMRIREVSAADLLVVTSRKSPFLARLEDAARTLAASGTPVAPVGWDAFNARRIACGSPWAGLDGGTERLVAEVFPEGRISYSKGCFLGQETLARLHHLGRANWILGRFRSEEGHPPPSQTDLLNDQTGAREGWLESGAPHPDGGFIAFGYLHRRLYAATGVLRLPDGRTVTTTSTMNC